MQNNFNYVLQYLITLHPELRNMRKALFCFKENNKSMHIILTFIVIIQEKHGIDEQIEK